MSIRVTQGQGGGYSHFNNYTRNAIDFGVGAGTPVLAGFSGVVAAAVGGCAASGSWGCNSGFGNFVYLKHADGTCALHAHLTAINVAAGQQIARYGQLGTVGSSGSSTDAHLHYDRLDCRSRFSLPWALDEAGRVTNGMGMREDTTPARLTTKPWSGAAAAAATSTGPSARRVGSTTRRSAQTTGERTTNGHDTDPSDDADPARFESTRYTG